MIHVLEKGRPILFSFLILDQEEHGQAKTMRKSTKCNISNAFSMTIINSHPTKKKYDELIAGHDTDLKFKINGIFGKRKSYACKFIKGLPSIVLPDAKDGWQGQDHGKRQNKVQPPTSVYSVKMRRMIPCSKYSRLGR